MTVDGVERRAPPQHHQQVVGVTAQGGVALGVLAGDGVAAGAVGAHRPLAVDVGAVQVHAAGERSGVRSGEREEVLEELVDPVGGQLGVDAMRRGRRPLGVEAVDGRLVGHPAHDPGDVVLRRPRPHRRRRVGRRTARRCSSAARSLANVHSAANASSVGRPSPGRCGST